jgi:hypothetical protein
MADGVAITAGSGTTIYTDDLGASGHVQRIKAGWGAENSYNDPAVATPLPVQATSESSQMTMGGTVVTPGFAVINTSSSGDTTLVAAAGASKVIRVIAYTLVCDAAVAVKFTSGAGGTALSGAMSFAANGGASAQCEKGLFQTATNTALVINLSAAVGVRGHLTYIAG